MRVHPILNNNTLIYHHHHHHNLTREFRKISVVSVKKRPNCFRFVAEMDGLRDGDSRGGGEMTAYMVEIHPGITKIAVRTNGLSLGLSLDELKLDVWHFSLPETTRLELVTVACVYGYMDILIPYLFIF